MSSISESDRRQLRLSGLFDESWYCQTYPDVARSGIDPAEHYLWIGARLNRRPGPAADRGALPRVGQPEALAVEGAVNGAVGGASPVVAWGLATPGATPGAEAAAWPPAPINDFWPAQSLRDFIIDSHGEAAIHGYWYLCSVMDAYRERQEVFTDNSPECSAILDRLRLLAGRRAEAQSGERGAPVDATIIVPVYNNILDTLLCLVSVFEIAGKRSFEIIVADDGSSDATGRLIPTIGGNVIYHRQPQNLGFLRNCNTSAALGSGRHVVLLNNDTLVLPGWLDELLAPFADPRIGLTGSKLINWDGTLQEAGGIFWEDGSAWNFGRGSDARAPQFNYVKEVDYCSGASIAVTRRLWEELGGFDEHYLPAYCEDSDLAFRVRAAGYRTVYTPFSEVIHHEGRSHGRDISSGIKAHQVTNQRKLVERWGATLRRDHYPNAVNVLRARDRSKDRKHVLIVDHYVPQWDQDAGSRTMYQYIRLYQELGFAVTFWPDNLWYDPEYAPELQKLGVEVIYGRAFHDGFSAFIEERAELYDTIFLSRPHVAVNYLDAIRTHSKARVLYYGHDLHFRRMEAQLALTGEGNPLTIAATREHELGVCRSCDVVFYPDPEEVATVQAAVGGNRRFIANPVFVYDPAQLAAARAGLERIATNASKRLLFVGGFAHTPNVEGIVWFVNEVMPLIEARVPGVHLDVAGSKPPAEVKALARANVDILGFVSDERLVELYVGAGLAVAPLRYGAGVKGKVIEAMAAAVPVATTSIGAQGIASGESALFLGDTPSALAEAIVLALSDRAEARARAAAALDCIDAHYSSEALKRLFLDVSLARH